MKRKKKKQPCVFNLHLLNVSLDCAAAVTDCRSQHNPSGSLTQELKVFETKTFQPLVSLTPHIARKKPCEEPKLEKTRTRLLGLKQEECAGQSETLRRSQNIQQGQRVK